MTLVLVSITFLVIRLAEEFLRKIIAWFIEKREPRKQYFYKRIVAIVSPEMHGRLKAHVLLLNITITEFILTAVNEKLKREEAKV